MGWDAHKEFTEHAVHARKAFQHVCGGIVGAAATVGKHEAKNHEHLRQVYAEAKEAFPRFADTLVWLLWHDILDADRLAALSKGALIEAERRGAERMRERAAYEVAEYYEHMAAENDWLDGASQAGNMARAIRALPLTEETPDVE